MSDSPTRTVRPADELLDKYTLPKVALALILIASLVGAWATTRLSGQASALAGARWLFVVSLGVLTGGLLWKHAFVRPADLETDALAYCEAMYARFDRIALGALAGVVSGGVPVGLAAADRLGGSSTLAYALLGGCAVGVAAVAAAALRTRPADEAFRSPLGLTALGFTVAATVGVAVVEAVLGGADAVAVGVRVLHVFAFAAWLGGAVWNIFVAVPAGQERATGAVIRVAGEQLERFRWVVRLIIPTLALTGAYQAVDALGTSLGPYLGTAVGLAVVGKAGLIGVLVVIFKLCPMWRACSPIDGICDLDDLGGTTDAADAEVTDGD